MTVLHAAVFAKELTTVEYLIENQKLHELLKTADDNGVAPIHLACKLGYKEIVVYFLTQAKKLKITDLATLKTTKKVQTPLHLAAKSGHLDIVTELIKEAPVNEVDKDNNTALHYAVESNSVPIVEFLLKNGADISMKNKNNKTPLDLAKEGNQKVFTFLSQQKNVSVPPVAQSAASAQSSTVATQSPAPRTSAPVANAPPAGKDTASTGTGAGRGAGTPNKRS